MLLIVLARSSWDFSVISSKVRTGDIYIMYSIRNKRFAGHATRNTTAINFYLFCNHTIIIFAVALRPKAGHGLLIHEVFLDHTQ